MLPDQLKDPAFRFVKIRKGEKRPFETKWQETANYSHDSPQLKEWLEAGENYGVLCTGDLVVVDTDTVAMEKKLRDLLPQTFTVKTMKGYHRYFLCQGVPSRKIDGLDLQSDNRQVVGPGSIHPSGAKYVVSEDSPIVRIDRNDFFDILGRVGINDSSVVDIEEMLKPQKQGNRDQAAFYLAVFFRKVGRTEKEVLEGLKRWNKNNQPPLTEGVLKEKTVSAFRDPPYKIHFVQNPMTWDKNKNENKPFILPKFHTGKELMTMELPKEKWLVQDLIPLSSSVLLAGRSHHGKTWAALELSLSVAAGEKVFNSFESKKARVIYFDDENGAKIFAERVRMFPKEKQPTDDFRLFSYSQFKLENPDWLNWLEEEIKNGVGLVVFDSFSGCHNLENENAAGGVREVLGESMGRLKEKYDIAFVMVHHLRKANIRTGKWPIDYMEEPRGSSELINYPDVVIGIGKRNLEDSRFQLARPKCRGARSFMPRMVEMKIENDTIEFLDQGEEEQYVTQDMKAYTEVMQWFEQQRGQLIQRKDVVEALPSFSPKSIDKALAKGVEEGLLRKPKIGKYQMKFSGQAQLGGDEI